LFFVFIFIEMAVAARRGVRSYRFADAIADLGCGVTQRVLLLLFEAILLLSYIVLYENARLWDLSGRPLAAFLIAFVGADFIYYCWHRASHRVNFLWAAHVVHHQSEDFNLAVALRQGVLTPITIAPFVLPMALIGVPPLAYVMAESVNTLYQFWIHTELVGRLGPLEYVFNTPSHHRVHHGRNPEYLDRNYAGVFIIWDRLFGTYVPEREKPDYGTTQPLQSFNALWAQVQPLVELTRLSAKAPHWRDRLAVWLVPPGYRFHWQRPQPVLDRKYDVTVSLSMRRYVLVNFAGAVIATFCLTLWSASLPWLPLLLSVGLVLLTVLTAGGLMEGRNWARPVEAARLVAVVMLLAVIVWNSGDSLRIRIAESGGCPSVSRNIENGQGPPRPTTLLLPAATQRSVQLHQRDQFIPAVLRQTQLCVEQVTVGIQGIQQCVDAAPIAHVRQPRTILQG
jgi:sterol desaturase/sphingolipid hydroxylase (fatty acid hydroxylase superfamily)